MKLKEGRRQKKEQEEGIRNETIGVWKIKKSANEVNKRMQFAEGKHGEVLYIYICILWCTFLLYPISSILHTAY